MADSADSVNQRPFSAHFKRRQERCQKQCIVHAAVLYSQHILCDVSFSSNDFVFLTSYFSHIAILTLNNQPFTWLKRLGCWSCKPKNTYWQLQWFIIQLVLPKCLGRTSLACIQPRKRKRMIN